MVAFANGSDIPKFDIITRVLILVAGADEETLRGCPKHDLDCVRAVGVLFILVWVYQASAISLIGRTLAPDGELHPDVLIGSMFVATLVLSIDSYVFGRAGFHSEGLALLKRGGLNLTGGIFSKLKGVTLLGIRILLSLGLSFLTGIFMGLILFHQDIAADIQHRFQSANAPLIAAANERVDAEIHRAENALRDATSQMLILQRQVSSARNGVVDPASGDVGVQLEQDEIRQLMTEKAQRDADLVAAQSFASDELAGKAGPGHSGVVGDGPVRQAAEERVETATANAAEVQQALDAARNRLDDMRGKLASTAGDRAKLSLGQLPELQKDLEAKSAEVASARAQLTKLVNGRDQAVRADIENSPDVVGRDEGILGQLTALERIAKDPKIAAVILLIDFVSFGLEAAAVLAKVTTFIPTEFSALLAGNSYLSIVRIVDRVDAELRGRSETSVHEGEDLLPPIFTPGSDEHETSAEEQSEPTTFSFEASARDSAASAKAPQEKRPRGRPRKYAVT